MTTDGTEKLSAQKARLVAALNTMNEAVVALLEATASLPNGLLNLAALGGESASAALRVHAGVTEALNALAVLDRELPLSLVDITGRFIRWPPSPTELLHHATLYASYTRGSDTAAT
jgi:hypothetical protein